MNEKGSKIKKTIKMEGLLVDYNFSYHATEGDYGGNVTKQFKTTE